MNFKKYTASGILEFYVLDLLTKKESEEVEQMMKRFPEIKKEVEAIEEALILMSKIVAKPTPKNIKNRILENI